MSSIEKPAKKSKKSPILTSERATAKAQQNGQPLNGRLTNGKSITTTTCSAVTAKPAITLKTSKGIIPIIASRLDDPEYAGKLPIWFRSASEIRLDNLLSLTDRQRITVLEVLANYNGPAAFVVLKISHKSLIDAVLALVTDDSQSESYARGKLAAFEVAALCYSESLELPCTKLKRRLVELGIGGVRLDELARDAKRVLKQIEERRTSLTGPRPTQVVVELYPDAPVAPDAVFPPNWAVEGESIISYSPGIVSSIECPVVIAGRGRDASGIEQIRLAWLREGKWCEKLVSREIVASTRTIVELAAFGLPVTSNNARAFVQYLADFETVNLPKLPTSLITSQCGYLGNNGAQGFLLGRRLITAEGVFDTLRIDSHGNTSSDEFHVYFRGADDGDDQLVDGFHEEGTYDGWLRAIAPLKNHPKARLALYAALTAPLLPVIDAPNFALDYAGESSKGKTVSICVGASCFGNPDVHSDKPRAISSWHSTGVFLERAPAVLRHVPFIVDDTANVLSNEAVSQTIYLVTQGRNKGRGSTKGVARQESYSTVLLSTGEQPITSFTEKGGVRGRVLQFCSLPFEPCDGVANTVNRLFENIKQNYGFAGPRFIQYLLQQRRNWPAWKRNYQKCRADFVERAEGNSLACRLAANFASIEVAAYLAHKSLDLPWEYASPTVALWVELTREAIDRATAALQHVMGWAASHPEDFYPSRNRQPAGGWVGRWDRNGGPSDETERRIACARREGRSVDEVERWNWIGFLPYQLKRILKEGQFEPEGIIRAWHSRGWLQTSGTRMQYRTRIGTSNPWVIAITRAAVEENCG